MPETIRFASTEELARDVADRFLTLLRELQADGRVPQVVLTGGTIANVIYEKVAERAADSGVDWSSVDFWWGDERYVGADDEDRNALQARRALLDRVGATRVHAMPTPQSACSVDEGARAYEAEVRGAAAAGFDLTLLSLGPDGHIASLFPGSPQLAANDRLVVGVTGSPKPPPERITLTFDALNRSERLWLFAVDTGPGGPKEEAFRRTQESDPTIPAVHVQGVRETTWFVA